ncbi:Integrase, catalytic core [Gossypium australe]|uniref:Integrase, catalytic core n=1 Tax=Gossypium australe TaxID=47621 RepID=A0A5B6WKJ3_9ROSI|nr:Integrase, catalytic core [Gossypium australe]
MQVRLKKFRMENCKETTTLMCQKEKLSKNDEAKRVYEPLYRKMVGSLMYLTITRPNILHAGSPDDMKSTSGYCFKLGSGLQLLQIKSYSLGKDVQTEVSVELKYYKTDLQLADMFTKALPKKF